MEGLKKMQQSSLLLGIEPPFSYKLMKMTCVFFWKYRFLAQFSCGKHIIFKKGVNICPCFECWSLHETCLLHHSNFASFFLTDQFKSYFKIADQDLFYITISQHVHLPYLLFETKKSYGVWWWGDWTQ